MLRSRDPLAEVVVGCERDVEAPVNGNLFLQRFHQPEMSRSNR